MKRKGDSFFLNNVMGVVIAAIVVIMIIAIGVSLYKANSNLESRNAKDIVKIVRERINSLEDGKQDTFNLRSPCRTPADCEWSLVAFSKSDGFISEGCGLDGCVCVCDTGNTWFFGDAIALSQIKVIGDEELKVMCQDKGHCANIDFDDISSEASREFITKIPGTDNREDKQVLKSKLIPLQKPLNEVSVSREGEGVSVEASTSPVVMESAGPLGTSVGPLGTAGGPY